MRWKQDIKFVVLRLNQEVALHDVIALAFSIGREKDDILIRHAVSGAPAVSGKKDWFWNCHTIFTFDFAHEHRHKHVIVVSRDGVVVRQSLQLCCPAEEETVVMSRDLEPVPRRVQAEPGLLRVALQPDDAPIVGVNIEAVLGDNPAHKISFIPSQSPLCFADLYLDESLPVVRGVNFNHPEWTLHDIALDTDERDIPIVTRFREHTGESRDPARVPCRFDRVAKWSADMANDPILHISMGAWAASFPVSFDHGVIPRDRLGGRRKRPSRPAPDDPLFVPKIEEYYLALLPPFRRVLDNGYHLVAGDLRVNLLAEDVLDQINDVIFHACPLAEDALCALSVLIGSSAGVLHSNPYAKVASVVHPRHLWALGKGFCSDVSNLFGLMAEQLAPRYGLSWKSWYAGLDGHVVCAIQWNDRFHVFDPMVGKFFYALDNRRLATLDEMRAIPEISRRVDCFNQAHGHEFYFGRDIQLRAFQRPSEPLLRVD